VLLRAAVLPAPADLARLALDLTPAVLDLTLPLALLGGLLVALGRWRDDGTWIALRACGTRGRRILGPALAAAAVCAGLLLITGHALAPAGRRHAAGLLAAACAAAELAPGGFLPLGGATLHRPTGGGLLLATEGAVVIARDGALEPRDGGLLLRLGAGDAVGEAFRGGSLGFASAEIPLPLPAPARRVEHAERADRELAALVERMEARGREAPRERLALLKRSSLPLAALLLPLVAVPLALRRGRDVPAALLVVLGQWVLVRTGDAACGLIGPWAAAALPPAGLLTLAVALWARWEDG